LNDYYFIGQIISLGKNGFLKFHSSVDQIDQYFNGNKIVFLEFWGKKKKFIVEETLKIKNSFFVKFFNFDDDRDAQVLIGCKIFVSEIKKNNIKKFYDEELIDCKVYQNGVLIGNVKNIFSAPANDVIEIVKKSGEEILLPFVDAFFEMMDVKNKALILKSDIGLYDDED
jgi:16S rRNA processing protein RimM